MSEDTVAVQGDAGEEAGRYGNAIGIGPRPEGAYIGLNHHIIVICDSTGRSNLLVTRGQIEPDRRGPCPACGRKAKIRIISDHGQ